MASTIIHRKKKRWENSTAEVNEIIAKIWGKIMGANIVVRAFKITKTKYYGISIAEGYQVEV